MAQFFDRLNKNLISCIENQKIFFVASADGDGICNLSPRGIRPLMVLNEQTVAMLDYHGSGNRTAEDFAAGRPVTLMFCSFTDEPYIIRLYCTAGRIHAPGTPEYKTLVERWPEAERDKGVRQIFEFAITRVQKSCGYGVPVYEYKGEKPHAAKLKG